MIQNNELKRFQLVSFVSSLAGRELRGDEIEDLFNRFDNGCNATAQDVNAMLEAIKLGRKIEAIKMHRTLTGFGLKESKDVIELHWPHVQPVY